MMALVAQAGALPVAWWGFWFGAALALFLGLTWVMMRLAAAADEDSASGEHATAAPSAHEVPPHRPARFAASSRAPTPSPKASDPNEKGDRQP